MEGEEEEGVSRDKGRLMEVKYFTIVLQKSAHTLLLAHTVSKFTLMSTHPGAELCMANEMWSCEKHSFSSVMLI